MQRIELFEELGKVMRQGVPQDVAQRAMEQNGWFTKNKIESAVAAICDTMLVQTKLSKWIEHYPTLPVQQPKRVLVIMAGNIPLVGFFDLLCTLMAGHEAQIKPSHKDRALMEWVVSLIKKIDNTIPIYIIEAEAEATAKPDLVIATGGDAAAIHFRERYRELDDSNKMLLRGTRHSIAILNSTERAADMQQLMRDIYDYSGLGCRNISMIFVPKGYDLQKLQFERDREAICTSNKYRNNYIQNRALMRMCGTHFVDNGRSCLVYSNEFPTRLSTISICEYSNTEELKRWIEQHDSEVQCIATNIQNDPQIAHPRLVKLGQAQRPTLLDYADGVDTMRFLES